MSKSYDAYKKSYSTTKIISPRLNKPTFGRALLGLIQISILVSIPFFILFGGIALIVRGIA